nr:hypothetical protein [Nocardia tengchongensis]
MSGAAGQHGGQQSEGQAQRAEVVGGHHALIVVEAVQRLQDRAAGGAAGVVDEDVDGVEFGEQPLDQLVDIAEGGDVAAVPVGAAPGFDDGGAFFDQLRAGARHQDHLGAVKSE